MSQFSTSTDMNLQKVLILSSRPFRETTLRSAVDRYNVLEVCVTYNLQPSSTMKIERTGSSKGMVTIYNTVHHLTAMGSPNPLLSYCKFSNTDRADGETQHMTHVTLNSLSRELTDFLMMKCCVPTPAYDDMSFWKF